MNTKKQQLNAYRPLSPDLIKNLDEWLKVELTYTSNAIEGNTLSRAETALVIEKGQTVEGKTLQEHQEAINHAQAFDWIKQRMTKKRTDITQGDILDIHRLILHNIDDANAGRYRTTSVRIAGSRAIMPNAAKVPQLMTEFISWLHQIQGDDVTIAAEAHFKLVSIHPFIDGNGRTARLLMNLLLIQVGFPPAIIRKEDRRRYIQSIEAGQLGKSLVDYYRLINESVDRSLDIYLDAVRQKEKVSRISQKNLLKIGELAKISGQTVPTLRFWTKQGLLTVSAYSPGGYQLYSPNMTGVIKKIRKLQNEDRLTLAEITKSRK